jgi:hypothetical protein
VIALALIAVAALPSLASAAGKRDADRKAVPAPRFGFMDDPEQHVFAMDAAVDIGANLGRITIPWYYTGWDQLDEIYDVFYANQVRPIITLAVTPKPGPGPTIPVVPPPVLPPTPPPAPQPQNLPPAPFVPDVETFRPEEYAAQAVYIVQRYPWAKLQLLNEPNLPQFRSFTVEQTVEAVVTAARAVHAVAPQARLIGPASSPDQGRGYAYTRAVYRQLPDDLDYLDAAANIYPGPGTVRAFRQVKKSWRTARASGRKTWVTEITPGIYSPRRRRCNQIKQAFSYLKAKGAKGILFFRLREPHELQNVQGRLWVVNLDGTHTDLYRCLEKSVKRLRKAGLPGDPELRMRVIGISWVDHGTGVQVRIRVTARPNYGSLGRGPTQPVPNAEVTLGGERVRTNGLGMATITVSLTNSRNLIAHVRHPGYEPDSGTIARGRASVSVAKQTEP